MVGPTGLAPAPAAARPESVTPGAVERAELDGPTALAPSRATGEGADVPDGVDVEGATTADDVPEPDQIPSIHYRHAVEHAGDVFEFEPGKRVRVPFEPRADDDWEVDGRLPSSLPAGHATGAQMRAARAGSDWASGLPPDVAEPAHFALRGGARDEAGRDEPARDDASRERGPVASSGHVGGMELASAVLPDATDQRGSEARVGRDGLRREVFGFLPYWELSDSSTVLDWRTLSTLAYFSVGCTGSGTLQKKNPDGSTTTGWAGWTSSKMTSIINAAHQHQSRVVLTVSCFAWSSSGLATQTSLLRSPANRSRLARQVAAAVRDRGADGVNLDFEPLAAGYADEFTSLVRAIRRELNAIAPGYQLTFDALASIGNQPIAAATAPGGADAVFVMGYDFRTASAAYAGSISPLSGPAYDLTDTVKAFTAKVSPSKVILGVPYYGRAWSTPTSSLHGRNISGARYGGSAEPSYAQAAELAAAYGRRWDSVEQAPWTAYRKRTCSASGCVTAWRQLYYDDAASLRLRYDLVNRTNLRGAGIWALGFDDSRPELRSALADKFLTDRTPPLVGVATLGQQQRDEGFRVAWSSYDDSGIRGYDIQVSIDGRAWAAWLAGTTLTSSIYLGAHGHTYAFRARAVDAHGNGSAWRSLALGDLDVPAGIKVGGFATVVTDGLRMRRSPSRGAGTMTTLGHGDVLQVIGGPTTREGYTWYRVAGPVRQWAAVSSMHVGGWVAASGSGVKNLAPRRPVYATRVDAGITGLKLAGGGMRALTPNGDGSQDTLAIAWTNRRAFDSVSLRVHRADGRLIGTVALGAGKRRAGPQAYRWDGRVGRKRVPAGAYVIQLRGVVRSMTFSAPSASPVSTTQVARFGVMVGPAAPTSVVAFRSDPASPTSARRITYTLQFGGAVRWLTAGDLVRSGTARCKLGAPAGSGATWTVVVTGCSAGTLKLSLKAGTVLDAVSNWGPASRVRAPALIIDRSAPRAGPPKARLRSGAALASTAPGTGVLTELAWRATDPGGAGVASYEVARSVDGNPFAVIATGLTSRSLAVALPPGHSYRFRVRPRDGAGNVGRWTVGAAVRPTLIQESRSAIAYRGTWRLGESNRASGLTNRSSTSAGASAKLTFTGRGIAWVTTVGPDRGAVKVYLDGVHVATVDTRAARPGFRVVGFSRTWAVSRTHTLKLVVVGTAGRPRVDLDAFELLR